jgi:peptidoglycan/xylan/chitin deacetylase (PgdA/CDA1 family)
MVLHICWATGLFFLTRSLMKDKLQILCYHGFETVDECSFRPKLFIKKETFTRRLQLISKYGFAVLPLGEALSELRSNKLQKNALVITIDDGFYSVLSVAANILNSYQYPSTLYLTTYYVEKETPIFRLAVQYMFWKTKKKRRIDLTDCVWKNTKYLDLANDKERDRVMWECIQYGENNCSESERVQISRQLSAMLGVDYELLNEGRLLSLLNIDEAKLLSTKGFDIQLHTHRHRFSSDNEMHAQQEILDNREVLGKIVRNPGAHFCYPSGIWNRNQWSWLEKLNVESATTCLPGHNDAESQVFGLTRFLDSEYISEIEFKAELFGFMELARKLRNKIQSKKTKQTEPQTYG